MATDLTALAAPEAPAPPFVPSPESTVRPILAAASHDTAEVTGETAEAPERSSPPESTAVPILAAASHDTAEVTGETAETPERSSLRESTAVPTLAAASHDTAEVTGETAEAPERSSLPESTAVPAAASHDTAEVAADRAVPQTEARPQARPSAPRPRRRRFAGVPQAELDHRQRLRELLADRSGAASPPRDPSWQQSRRRLEQDIRNDVVAMVQELRGQGMSATAAADLLGGSDRTARRWCQQVAQGQVQAPWRGRPHLHCTRARAEDVVRFLQHHGPHWGMPNLRAQFEDVPPAELHDLLSAYRHLWLLAHPRECWQLHWHRAGAVWAMDFTELSRPIDGLFRYVFAVRDLCSGMQLAWRPVLDMTEQTAQRELQVLYLVYGAPLLLKSDNGSAFRAEALKRFSVRWQVWLLYSPPGQPWYNGAIEASIGAMARRTEFEAYLRGSEDWSSADLERAQALANELGRPQGCRGPTPAEAWAARRPPSQADRDSFAVLVRRLEVEARAVDGIAQDADLDHYEQAALHRRVLQEALVECGYLSFTRRRLPQRLFGKKAANFR